MNNNTTPTEGRQPFDTLPVGESVVLIESHLGLPPGTTITRRPYSWAVELPSEKGYNSCGVTIGEAASHALSGAPQQNSAMSKLTLHFVDQVFA